MKILLLIKGGKKKPRHLKLMNLLLFLSVWEGARFWVY